MAWTTPRTWITAEFVTAAIMNLHLRDNLSALYGGSLAIASQAAYDTFYAASATAMARLANGTTGQVLTATTGAAPSWGAAAAPGGADLVFTSDYNIRRNTSDGSDSGYLVLAGGGASGSSRGASIFLYGNEAAGTGRVVINVGNVANSDVTFANAAGAQMLNLLGSDGTATFSGTIKPKGLTTAGIPSFDTSNDALVLADTATQTFTMSSGFVMVYDATNGEGALFAIMNSVSAIVWQKAALFATVSTGSKVSIECAAGVVTVRNRSGSSETLRMNIMKLQ